MVQINKYKVLVHSGVLGNGYRAVIGFSTVPQLPSTPAPTSKPTQPPTPPSKKVVSNVSSGSNDKVSSHATVPKSIAPKPTVAPITKQIIHSGITVTGCASTDINRYYDSPYLTSDVCADVPLSL